jgi:hypothetical protein
MARILPKLITELPAAEEAAIERRYGGMADAERQIEMMRRGNGKWRALRRELAR